MRSRRALTSRRPLWALRYGRFKLSGSRSSGLLGGPGTEKHSGASADLVDNDRWSLNFGLRMDNGRSAGDDPVLAGLPEIRSTLRGRLAAWEALGESPASPRLLMMTAAYALQYIVLLLAIMGLMGAKPV